MAAYDGAEYVHCVYIVCVCLTHNYVESGYNPAQETPHCPVCQHVSMCVCVCSSKTL